MVYKNIKELIKSKEKFTPVKVYIELKKNKKLKYKNIKIIQNKNLCILFGNWLDLAIILNNEKNNINEYFIESNSKNQLFPLFDSLNYNGRIEPGSIIRDGVFLEDNVIILMGAVINVGAKIGANTMIDMNAVIGSNACVGKNCHIGAGAVISGVLEPYTSSNVVIKDNVLIGANSVILEGVTIDEGAVIGAGSIVLNNVGKNEVVCGNPAKFIKYKDEKTKEKIVLLDELR